MTDSEVVRGILEQALANRSSVSKRYVCDEIRNRIDPIRLFNKVLTYPDDRSDGATTDGLENLKRGAMKVFRDSIRSLKNHFVVDKDGMVSKRSSPPENAVSDESQEYNKLWEYDGKRMNVREWAAFVGMNEATLRARLHYGWDFADALTRAVNHSKRPRRLRRPSERTVTRQQKLLSLITEDWQSQQNLKVLFAKSIDDKDAIAAYERRVKTESKRDKGRWLKTDDRQSQINYGNASIFAHTLAELKKKKLIEKDGKSNVRKSKKS